MDPETHTPDQVKRDLRARLNVELTDPEGEIVDYFIDTL